MFAARQGLFPPAAAPAANTRRTGAAASLSTITFSAYNSANYSTDKAQFGAGSLNLVSAGNNRLIYYNNYNAASTGGGWPTGTGDFCLEGWVWVPSGRSRAVTGDYCSHNTTGALGVRFGAGYNSGGFNYLQIWARGQADLDRAPFTWPDEQWCHWAVQRKSSVISLWANGNKLARENGPSGTAATRNFASGTAQLTIGSYNNGGGTDETMRSWLDEFCASNSWRYDDSYSTYEIPTAEFAVDEYTDLLIHWDSSLTTAGS